MAVEPFPHQAIERRRHDRHVAEGNLIFNNCMSRGMRPSVFTDRQAPSVVILAFPNFSLKSLNNQADSAIRRFDPSRPAMSNVLNSLPKMALPPVGFARIWKMRFRHPYTDRSTISYTRQGFLRFLAPDASGPRADGRRHRPTSGFV